jgi:hypothetical protein
MEWMAGKCKAEGAEEDRGAVATVPVGGGGGQGTWESGSSGLSLCWNLQVFYK